MYNNRKRKNESESSQEAKRRKQNENSESHDVDMGEKMKFTEEEEEDEMDEMFQDIDDLEDEHESFDHTTLNDKISTLEFIDRRNRKEWRRDVISINPSQESVAFQMMETDYSVFPARKFSNFRYDGRQSGQIPVVRLYGVNEKGNSVLCRVWGFTPYIYAEMPPNFDFSEESLQNFRQFLNNRALRTRVNLTKDTHFVERIECVEKTSVWMFQFRQKKKMLKIFTGIPSYCPRLRDMLENGIDIPGIQGTRRCRTFESNVLFVLRCLIDIDVNGCDWVEIPKGQYQLNPMQNKKSHCDIEIDCSSKDLIPHSSHQEQWAKIAPIRILSFDIECMGYTESDEEVSRKNKRKGRGRKMKDEETKKKKKKKKKIHFPQAERKECCVIQIANTITVQGENKPRVKNVFVLDTCSEVNDCEILSFQSEKRLLEEWAKFVLMSDPDIITGYNIINFDIPYLLDRAKFLKVEKFKFLGRLIHRGTEMRKTTFSSKQMGTMPTRDIKIHGRIILDVLNVIRRDYKLSSYSLNNVSSHFLKQQKEDVHYSIMNELQKKNEDTRKRLAMYCLKDALLPQRLIDKLMMIFNNVEMARVTGIPMSMILSRGQQIKVLAQLLRESKERDLVIPYMAQRGGNDEGKRFAGATVIEPKTGFYNGTPISTLDFASLYPSIMIAHNLCYTTMIPSNRLHEFKKEDYTTTPVGYHFVKKGVFEGLLPVILRNLLDARAAAKRDLKKATDPIQKAVLNGRQLALKVSANSVYGFTGAARGQLPCLPISASVTSFGREMLEQTKNWVENKYCRKNGFPWDSEIIYGDTDSVMIKFGTSSMKEAIDLGKEAGVQVSKIFIPPIRLEFEKAYDPYLLLAKKHYAGLLFTKAEKHDKIDTKGIETVRRDKAAIIRNLYKTCLHLILVERSVEKAKKYVKMVIQTLLRNELDISMLIITKTLSLKEYKSKQAHSELAERLRKRDPATAPKQGDRVMFVYIQKGKDAKDYEKGEDPSFVLKKDIALDTTYYLEKKLKPSIRRLFDRILTEKEMTELFSGEHTRKIVIPTPANLGLFKYYKKKVKCIGGCRRDVDENEAVCEVCKPREAEIYFKVMSKRNHFENLYSQAWSYCQRCQECIHQEVLCTNDDCPIFFMREQVKHEIHKIQKKLERFGDDLSW